MTSGALCSCVASDGLLLPRPMRNRAWRLYTHPLHPLHKQLMVDYEARTTETSDLHSLMWCGVHFVNNVVDLRRHAISNTKKQAEGLVLQPRFKDFLNAAIKSQAWNHVGDIGGLPNQRKIGFDGISIVGPTASGKTTYAQLSKVIWEQWGYDFSGFSFSDLINNDSAALALKQSNAVLIDDIVFTSQGYQQLGEVTKFRAITAYLTQRRIPTILVLRHSIKQLNALEVTYSLKGIGPVLELKNE